MRLCFIVQLVYYLSTFLYPNFQASKPAVEVAQACLSVTCQNPEDRFSCHNSEQVLTSRGWLFEINDVVS